MKEDIEVIDEFMGPIYFCETPHEEWESLSPSKEMICKCGAFSIAHPIVMPVADYPNDMNALLGVMDKLGDCGDYDPTEYLDSARMFLFDRSLKCVDLPRVLTPLLADAIIKINETKS